MKLFDLETFNELSNQELTALSGGHKSSKHHKPHHKHCHYYLDKHGKMKKHNKKDTHTHQWWKPCHKHHSS